MQAQGHLIVGPSCGFSVCIALAQSAATGSAAAVLGDAAQRKLLQSFLEDNAMPQSRGFFNALELCPEGASALQKLVDRGLGLQRMAHVIQIQMNLFDV